MKIENNDTTLTNDSPLLPINLLYVLEIGLIVLATVLVPRTELVDIEVRAYITTAIDRDEVIANGIFLVEFCVSSAILGRCSKPLNARIVIKAP